MLTNLIFWSMTICSMWLALGEVFHKLWWFFIIIFNRIPWCRRDWCFWTFASVWRHGWRWYFIKVNPLLQRFSSPPSPLETFLWMVFANCKLKPKYYGYHELSFQMSCGLASHIPCIIYVNYLAKHY